MKKLLAPVAALLLAASPAVAQQAVEAPGSQNAAQQTQVEPVKETRTPTVHVTRAEVRQRVQANEERLANAQVTSTNWWWLVAAIAAGVVIAAIVL